MTNPVGEVAVAFSACVLAATAATVGVPAALFGLPDAHTTFVLVGAAVLCGSVGTVLTLSRLLHANAAYRGRVFAVGVAATFVGTLFLAQIPPFCCIVQFSTFRA